MATGTYVRPGQVNTYVRNHEATGNMIVMYSRAPNKFALPKYVQYRPVSKTTGLYLRITPEEAGRITNSNLADYVWPDGADRPTRSEMERFRYEDYRTQRYAFPWQLGRKAVEEADWPVDNVNQQIIAQKAMTGRTQAVATVLQTEANWATGHYGDVADISGNSDSWENSTTAAQDIKRSITYGIQEIQKSTFSVVKQEDLVLVMNPTTARRVGTSQEIIDFVKQQESAPAILSHTTDWVLSQYGLPARLYGVPVLVEDTVMITSKSGAATETRTYPMDDGNAFLLARPGSIEASAGGGPSFSTITLFMLEEMTVEQKDDPDNRRIVGTVVDDYDTVMTANTSGYWFQNVSDSDSSS